MPKDHRLLRKYIKESLLTEKSFLDDISSSVSSGIKGALGFDSKGKKGPQKWFADFLNRQLDSAGEKIDKALGQKLDQLLPDDLKTKVAQYEKQTGESSSTSLAKVVSSWIEDFEEMSDKEFTSAEEKQISDYAASEYAAILRKDPDVKKALILIKRKLDMKYGSLLSKSKKKTK